MRGRKQTGVTSAQLTVFLRDPSIKGWVMEQAKAEGRSMSNWVEDHLADIRQRHGQSALFRAEDGRILRATTDHQASSYGLPVLVDEDGEAHGSGDVGPVTPASDNTSREWIDRLRKARFDVTTSRE